MKLDWMREHRAQRFNDRWKHDREVTRAKQHDALLWFASLNLRCVEGFGGR
jgi:hypothetical protein